TYLKSTKLLWFGVEPTFNCLTCFAREQQVRPSSSSMVSEAQKKTFTRLFKVLRLGIANFSPLTCPEVVCPNFIRRNVPTSAHLRKSFISGGKQSCWPCIFCG